MAKKLHTTFESALPRFEQVLFILSVLTLILGTTSAIRAQSAPTTGAFSPGSSWFLGPAGLGVQAPLPGDTTIEVDTNGDSFVDTTFNLPAEIRKDTSPVRQFDLEYRLSPSQDVLYVKKLGDNGFPVCGSQNQVEVYLYRLNNAPSMTPFTGDQGICMFSPINMGPFFHDQESNCIRTMVMVGAASFGRQAILWADLVNGVMSLDSNTYNEGVTTIQYAPSGNAALVVHHDAYSLIDLCVSRVAGTAAVSTRPIPTGTGPLSARVAQNGNVFNAILQRSNQDVQGASIGLDLSCFNCFTPGGAACCFPDGSCVDLTDSDCAAQGGTPDPGGQLCAASNCSNTQPQACCFPNGSCDDLTEADCQAQGGTPRGVGTTCANTTCPQPPQACCFPNGACTDSDPRDCLNSGGEPGGAGTRCGSSMCPTLDFDVTLEGPDRVERGETYEYVVTYRNTGDLDARSVRITGRVPNSTTFVSISNGGNFSGSNLSWDLGDIPMNASGEVSFQVRAGCADFPPQIVMASVSLTSSGVFFTSNDLTTDVDAANEGAVDITVQSVPASGAPLQGGDVVTHTITITDRSGADRNSLTFSVSPGNDMSFEALLDAGTGEVNMFGNFSWTWQGTINANGTTNIIFTTRLEDCPQARDTALNNGELTLSHSCFMTLGEVETQTLDILRPVEVELFARNLAPPTRLISFIDNELIQVARVGDSIEFCARLENPFSTTLDAVSFEFTLPPDLVPDGNPPFLAPVPAGASWDNTTRRVTWAGPLAAGEILELCFGASVPSGADCRISMVGTGSQGGCDVQTNLQLKIVPEPPLEEHVLTVDNFGDLWTFRPGTDATPTRLLCITGEFITGMSVAPNGDIWASGLPTYRFNPLSVEIEGVDLDRLRDLGMSFPSDVAYDATNDTVVFAGSSLVGGDRAVLARFDPATGQATPIFQPDGNAGIRSFEELLIDTVGNIIALANREAVLRFDPSDPDNFETLNDPGDFPAATLCFDQNGNYVISEQSTSPTRRVASIDAATGDLTVLIDDLTAILPGNSFFEAAGIDSSDQIFLGSPGGGLAVARPGNPATGEVLVGGFGGVQVSDLAIMSERQRDCTPDTDSDGVNDCDDNCIRQTNTNQADFDADGIGDACETDAVLADIDGSGLVDGFDLARFGRAAGSQCGDPTYDAAVDLNRDCVIDDNDRAILEASFGASHSGV